MLREISRAGSSKIAASLYWNVNGTVTVTCARKGKVVASIDLSYVEEEDLAEMPRSLRPLARLCVEAEDAEHTGAAAGVDVLAVGAAMVDTYTGVAFTRQDLEAASVRGIVPRPSDLTTYPRESQHWAKDPRLAELGGSVADRPDPDLRLLAEWAATAAVREAGLTDEPAVREVLGQFGSGVATALPRGLDALRRRFAAETQRLQAQVDEVYDESAFNSLDLTHAHLPENALAALRSTSHPDAYSAAVGALLSAVTAFSCTKLERRVQFVEDERGRYRGGYDPSPRREQLVHVVRQVVAAEPASWPGLTEQLPEPLSAGELAAAADADRRWQEAGAFNTWQIAEPQGVPMDVPMELVQRIDPEAHIRARYQALEERDRVMATHEPITPGAREPLNPGGFAVAFADGLRIERLPVGRAAGNLYLTYVFTHEFGFDPNDDPRLGFGLYPRIAYKGPRGALTNLGGGGSGGGSDTSLSWHTQLETTGLSWIQIDYREKKTTIATEKIPLD